MKEAPDYRSRPMESYQGKGLAKARYEGFMAEELEHLCHVFAGEFPDGWVPDYEEAELLDSMALNARERSELIGFWVAWHTAGGFDRLEMAGWHQATIYRKIRRFRAYFDQHPDECTFPWINLDLRGYWIEEIRAKFEGLRPLGDVARAAAEEPDEEPEDYEPPAGADEDYEAPDVDGEPDDFILDDEDFWEGSDAQRFSSSSVVTRKSADQVDRRSPDPGGAGGLDGGGRLGHRRDVQPSAGL